MKTPVNVKVSKRVLLKTILIALFLPKLLVASQDDFFQTLHETLQQERYAAFDRVQTFEDVETNSTKALIKKDFEALLPLYYHVEDIADGFDANDPVNEVNLAKFFKLSALYINLTQNKTLLAKNLHDLNTILKKSSNLMAYELSLEGLLIKYYEHLTFKNSRYKDIFKKYPIPSSGLYFKLLKQEWHVAKSQLLKGVKQMDGNKTEQERLAQKALEKQIETEMDYYLNSYIDMIQQDSPAKLDAWIKGIKAEDQMSLWKSIKLLMAPSYFSIKHSIFGVTEYDNFVTKEIAKKTARLALSLFYVTEPSYYKHQQLLRVYQKCIN